jgi:hypothetical protein
VTPSRRRGPSLFYRAAHQGPHCSGRRLRPDPRDWAPAFEKGLVEPVPAEREFRVDSTVAGSATARKAQRQRGKRVVVKVKVKALEALTAKATGKIRMGKASYRLKPLVKQIPSGQSKVLKLRLKRGANGTRIARALARGKRATARLTVRLADEAGNTAPGEVEALRPKASADLTSKGALFLLSGGGGIRTLEMPNRRLTVFETGNGLTTYRMDNRSRTPAAPSASVWASPQHPCHLISVRRSERQV